MIKAVGVAVSVRCWLEGGRRKQIILARFCGEPITRIRVRNTPRKSDGAASTVDVEFEFKVREEQSR